MAFTRFTDLSGPSVTDLSADTVAVLPVGAIEQHGPHLPVATDYFMAEAIAEGAALAASDSCDITLLPGLAYAKSDEHAWSPGTLWLSASTLFAVLDDLGRSSPRARPADRVPQRTRRQQRTAGSRSA